MKNMNKIYRQKTFTLALLAMVLLCSFIFSTDPRNLSAGLLLVPPILLFIIIYVLTYTAFQSYTEVAKAKIRVVSGVVATAPVILLLFGSLGQLTGKDTFLSLLFVGGLAAYFSKVALNHSSS